MPRGTCRQRKKKLPKEPSLGRCPLNASGASDGRRTSDSEDPNGTSRGPPQPVPGHKQADRNTQALGRNTPEAAGARSRPEAAADSTPAQVPHTPAPPAHQTRCRRSHAPTPSAARPALPVRLHLQSTAHCVESSSSPAARAPGKSVAGAEYGICIVFRAADTGDTALAN